MSNRDHFSPMPKGVQIVEDDQESEESTITMSLINS